jgi:hypothetical protein
MHFWERHHSMPPAQNTVIVYKDGSVLEGNNFGPDILMDEDVHRVFTGGYKHVVEPTDDPLSYTALVNAGYIFGVPTQDIYAPSDKYTDQYPVVDTAAAQAARDAEARAARLALIAQLEAEIAALRGLTP